MTLCVLVYAVASLSSLQVGTISDDPVRAPDRLQRPRPLENLAAILTLFF